MPKIFAEIKAEKVALGKIIASIFITLSAFAVACGFIWTTIHDSFEDTIDAHETVIESLNNRLKQVDDEYNELANKVAGINELQLWKSDMIRDEQEAFLIYGGKVYFIIKEMGEKKLYHQMFNDNIIYFIYSNDIDSVYSDVLEIFPNENFPFKVDEQKFLLKFAIPFPDSAYVKAEVYKVEPLYVGPATN